MLVWDHCATLCGTAPARATPAANSCLRGTTLTCVLGRVWVGGGGWGGGCVSGVHSELEGASCCVQLLAMPGSVNRGGCSCGQATYDMRIAVVGWGLGPWHNAHMPWPPGAGAVEHHCLMPSADPICPRHAAAAYFSLLRL
jgi:hypothetical protein